MVKMRKLDGCGFALVAIARRQSKRHHKRAMGYVTELDEYRPHEFWEAMCVKCLDRWIAVVPVGMLLKKIECKTSVLGASAT